MDLSVSLCLLVEVINTGSLSAAARKLHTSRSNISYHLARLEANAGQQILRRTTRRLEPTELGLRLYEHGRRIQDELVAAQESVELLGSTLHGRIRISVPTGYGQLVMRAWLLEFKHLYPDIALDVVFENGVDDLLRDEVDIAVRVMWEPPQLLVARKLGTVRYIACATREYAKTHRMPQTPDELRQVPLITSTKGARQLRLSALRGETKHEVMLQPTLSSENFLFLREAILSGLGVGVVADYVVHDCILQGDIVTALDDYQLSVFGTHMFMLYMPNRHHTLSTSTFIDFILQKARNVEGLAEPD